MTKQKAIESIYGTDPTFTYDTAVPDEVVNRIVDAVKDYYSAPRQSLYARIAGGCVYAYCKVGRSEGFIPLTEIARQALKYYEFKGNASVRFTPVIG